MDSCFPSFYYFCSFPGDLLFCNIYIGAIQITLRKPCKGV